MWFIINHHHRLSRWFVFRPIRAHSLCWSLKTHRKVRQPQHQLLAKPLGLITFSLITGSPVNGSIYSFIDIWSYSKSSFNWFRIYSSIFFAFFSYCINIISSTSKMSISIFIFEIRMPFKYHKCAFPFKYPTNSDTLIFGVISTNIWTWSGHISASTIWTSFHLHSMIKILAMSCLNSPYIIFLLLDYLLWLIKWLANLFYYIIGGFLHNAKAILTTRRTGPCPNKKIDSYLS